MAFISEIVNHINKNYDLSKNKEVDEILDVAVRKILPDNTMVNMRLNSLIGKNVELFDRAVDIIGENLKNTDSFVVEAFSANSAV